MSLFNILENDTTDSTIVSKMGIADDGEDIN